MRMDTADNRTAPERRVPSGAWPWTGAADVRSAAVAVCLACLSACSEDPAAATLNVGLLLPFTGEVGAMGTNLEQASLLVADRVNANGGVTGRKLRFVVGDTHSDVSRARESLERILAEDVVAVVGPESADVAAAILPILRERRVLAISPYGTASLDSTDASVDYPWFRLAATAISFGEALAKRIISDGSMSAAVVYTRDPYNSALAAAAVSMLRQLGGKVVIELELPVGEGDYSSRLMQLPPASFPLVVLAADPISGARIANDISVLFPDEGRDWYFSPSLKTSSFVQNALPEKIEGAIGVAPVLFAATADFEREFAAAWNGARPLDGAFYYYDAMALLSLSIERAWVGSGGQDPTFEALRDAVREVARTRGTLAEWRDVAKALSWIREKRTVYYSGFSGPLIMSDTGARQMGTAAFWKVQGGQIVSAD